MRDQRLHGQYKTVGEDQLAHAPAPGRRTLTEGFAAPSRGANAGSVAAPPPGEASLAKNEGIAADLAAAQSREHAYPHRATIESLFGCPVTARAYVDPGACDLIGAEAYRARERVVFDSAQPTLHTAAHEAAHVVSGADEHAADRAADAVVAGQSAASFLVPASSPAPRVQAKPKAKPPDPSPIVYVGMNAGAKKEAETLEKANKDRGGVDAIINNPDKQDTFTDGAGNDHDLTDDPGTASLVEAWGISKAQAAAVEQLVKDTSKGTKDEVFQLAKAYAEAESGKRTMERVVLSGHSVGGEIFGQGAWMDFAVLVKLKTIFPTAAGGVKHVMISACSSGYEATMAKFQEAFPSVKTIEGYAGVCPTGEGARNDLRDWEDKTDDKGEVTLKPPGHGVGTWSEKEGYKGGEAMTFADALAAVQGSEAEFQSYLAGKKEVASSSSGPMYTYYRSLQRLLGKSELVDPDRTKWTERMKVTVRLRFWPDIRGKFGDAYHVRLKKGYDALSRKMPVFSTITRADALAEVSAFEAASAPDAADALGLLRGLRDLDEKTIDGGWL